MQASKTYNKEHNDQVNRAKMARICSEYFGIKDVSPCLYEIAVPVSEIAYENKYGKRINYRDEIEEAIPWNERSMKTFGVVYRYEAVASFIGMDGRTYAVPNDKPVLDHLEECGYMIAPYGLNLDGGGKTDTLIYREKVDDDYYSKYIKIDKNLPPDIVKQINEMEKDRPYIDWCESYISMISFGGSFGLDSASEDEMKELSLNERKIANIETYGRVFNHQKIEDYVQYAKQQYYLDDSNFIVQKK